MAVIVTVSYMDNIFGCCLHVRQYLHTYYKSLSRIDIQSFVLLSHIRLIRWSSPSIVSMRLLFKQSLVKDVNSHKLSILGMSVKEI